MCNGAEGRKAAHHRVERPFPVFSILPESSTFTLIFFNGSFYFPFCYSRNSFEFSRQFRNTKILWGYAMLEVERSIIVHRKCPTKLKFERISNIKFEAIFFIKILFHFFYYIFRELI